ncbi:MAG: glycoside hydrolase [Roseiflexaceae bacterium]|nr:glycoside hydrolase [Roseiflexaceae bacterium]
MAGIKIVYLGGGATRGPGTLASFVRHAAQYAGSEIVLVDVHAEQLELVRRVGQRIVEAEGADIRLRATTDRRAALHGADAVLSSFRPGGFEARRFDEHIPLAHGVIGQETQGPGGFFMALRAINVLKQVVAEMEHICPQAWLINYTNPINIISDAITRHSSIRTISLCEGPIYFPRTVISTCGLDPAKLDAVMIGLNHACWSVRHLYDGQDVMPLIRAAAERVIGNPQIGRTQQRMVELAVMMGHLPADYFQYYYFRDELLAELQNAPRSRSEVILSEVPSYYAHYAQQAEAEHPHLDPAKSRGGIMELELAVDVLAALVNDEGRVFPCNVPNQGAIPNFAAERVVEVPCLVDRRGATPLVQPGLPVHVAGLVEQLGHYQALAADAAWQGTRTDGIRALASNPLVLDLPKATLLYDALAAAHQAHLPERLLK